MSGLSLPWTPGSVPRRGLAAAAAVPRRAVELAGAATSLVETVVGLEPRILRLLEDVEALVAHVRQTALQADVVVANAHATSVAADQVVQHCADQVARAAALLEPLMQHHAAGELSTAEHAARTVGSRHVDSATQLLDLVPELLDLILPALRGLGELSPGIDQLGERMENIAHIVEGVPGAGALKRRGTERIQSE